MKTIRTAWRVSTHLSVNQNILIKSKLLKAFFQKLHISSQEKTLSKELKDFLHDPQSLDLIFHELSQYQTQEGKHKHFKDKFHYYTFFSRREKFNFIALPSIIFLALFLGSLLPPCVAIGGGLSAAQIQGMGSFCALMYLKSWSSRAARVTFLSFFRQPTIAFVPKNVHGLKAPISTGALSTMTSLLTQLQHVCAHSGQFYFHFVNSFKYYLLIKKNCDHMFQILKKI
jgi:hypothetical protein